MVIVIIIKLYTIGGVNTYYSRCYLNQFTNVKLVKCPLFYICKQIVVNLPIYNCKNIIIK